jgi:integrase
VKIGDQDFPNLLRKPSGFYWNAPPRSREHFGSIPLGKELNDEALARYCAAQRSLERWRQERSAGRAGLVPPRGTIDWLLWDYFNHRWFAKLPEKTGKDYRNKLRAMTNFRLLDGSRFGSLPWRTVEAKHTDRLHEMMCFAEDGGLRETYARAVMHTARLVWNWAKRYHRKHFEFNPFEDMRLAAPDPRTVKWEPAQVWKFCQKAQEMGRLSVALAAVFCYELGQRVGDARRMCRSAFDGDSIICVEQGKTAKRLVLPVSKVLASYVAKVPGDRDELVMKREDRQTLQGLRYVKGGVRGP